MKDSFILEERSRSRSRKSHSDSKERQVRHKQEWVGGKAAKTPLAHKIENRKKRRKAVKDSEKHDRSDYYGLNSAFN